MALKTIQLCHIDPLNRVDGIFTVTCNSDSGEQNAVFLCTSERDAIDLRNAIRQYAERLLSVSDFS
jgi:hypothetical protein